MRIRMELGAAGVAVAVLLGCGASDDASWGPVIGRNQGPRIEHLAIEHDDPDAPGVIRAVVEARDPDGDAVEISYAWEVAGVAREETGPELALPRARKGTRVTLRATASNGRTRSEVAQRVVHLQNPRPDPVVALERPVGLGETIDPPSEGGWAALPEAGSDGRGAESRPEVTALEAEGPGEALHYAVEAPLVDGASRVRFRLLLGPEGMWVHPASGEVTWVPEPWQTDSYEVEVEVSDETGVVSVESFDVNAGFEVPAPPMPAKIAAPEPEAVAR